MTKCHGNGYIPMGMESIAGVKAWFNMWKSKREKNKTKEKHVKINLIDYINRMKDSNHMIISIDADEAFDKIQHFHNKNAQKLSRR